MSVRALQLAFMYDPIPSILILKHYFKHFNIVVRFLHNQLGCFVIFFSLPSYGGWSSDLKELFFFCCVWTEYNENEFSASGETEAEGLPAAEVVDNLKQAKELERNLTSEENALEESCGEASAVSGDLLLVDTVYTSFNITILDFTNGKIHICSWKFILVACPSSYLSMMRKKWATFASHSLYLVKEWWTAELVPSYYEPHHFSFPQLSAIQCQTKCSEPS